MSTNKEPRFKTRAEAEAYWANKDSRMAEQVTKAAKTSSPAAEVPDLVLETPPDKRAVKRNQQLEHHEQVQYFNLVKQEAVRSDAYASIFAIPNGTPTSQRMGAYMVSEGVRAGVPDICIPLARVSPSGHLYNTLFIEMKAPIDTAKIRDSQMEWISRLKHNGCAVCVCDNWRDAWNRTAEYIGWMSVNKFVDDLQRRLEAIERVR